MRRHRCFMGWIVIFMALCFIPLSSAEAISESQLRQFIGLSTPEAIRHPQTGEVLIEAGTTITEEMVQGIIDSGWLERYKQYITPVTGVGLSESELTMLIGDTEIIYAYISPRDATFKVVRWVSSDSEVLQVTERRSRTTMSNASATLTALSPGTAVVTAITVDGNRRASCQVQVLVPVRDMNLAPTEATLKPGETLELQAWVEPTEGTNPEITWESTDPAVARVSDWGTVTAGNEGEARVIVRSVQDSTVNAFCAVTVTEEEAEEVVADTDEDDVDYILFAIIGITALALIALVAVLLSKRKRSGRTSGPPSPPGPRPRPDSGRTNAGSNSPQQPAMTELRPQSGGPGPAIRPQPDAAAESYRLGNMAGAINPAAAEAAAAAIKALSGHFAGETFALKEGKLVIGRDPHQAWPAYPVSQEMISRKHLTISYDQGSNRYVLEDSSSNGTFLASNQRLEPGKPYYLHSGDRFYLAVQDEMFELL